MFDIAIDDQDAVRRKEVRKFTKRITDIVNVLEVIQMIFFYIKYNADLGEKA